jgi:hypothetical protein
VAYHANAGKHPDAVARLRAAGDAARAEFHNAEAMQFYQSAMDASKECERGELME